MTTHQDWDPRAPDVLADPIAAYDRMRQRCPVAHSDYLHHSVFRHADVMRILTDHETFSSQASRFVSVPNSMDPPEHTAYRALIEPYFGPARMAAFEPTCRRICNELVAALPRNNSVEIMFNLAHPFALRMQCAFLGWPDSLHEPLLQWIHKKNVATLSGDGHAIAAVATEFDQTIRDLLKTRRLAGDQAPDDITTSLMRDTVNGHPLTEDEIVSILRNWTVGELGTMASSIGIIAHYLAIHPKLQDQLRHQPELVGAANDEILRMHAPLIANRRTPTCPVRVGSTQIQPGERLTLIWASANRDEAVFGDPDEFRLDRDPNLNLLYGVGIHACPGAPLARLEIEAMIQALLAGTQALQPSDEHPPIPAIYPASGYRQAILMLRQ
ncbi:cytochrome P450 [Castellaniella sp.]|uniref:cytochrome P450 n=1 Tax=Castellaniella sp. TaxID=1955812 RepID=UPI002AFE96A9|nr:cytochrome P450 [Castellaniella sp.]